MGFNIKKRNYKVSSIIFVDLPAGTGFSYPKTERAVQQSSSKLVRHAHQFIRKRSEEGLCDLLHNLHFELHHQAFSSIQSPDVGPHFGRYCHFTSVFII
ncbi:hypothetical protein JHK85_035912 [Glycine max]|nr:hypothetical protein JHK85_035912 [Glycine max]